MGIPYRGLGLITLVGTTHDTSLLYAGLRGQPAGPGSGDEVVMCA